MPAAPTPGLGRRAAAPRRAARGVITIAGLGVLLAGCEFPAEPVPRPEETPSSIASVLQARDAEAAKLYRVVETYFNDWLALNPIRASELGDRRFDDRFGDYASASWMADSLGIEQEALERFAAVDPKQLQGEDRLTYEAFKRQRELEVYGYRYPSELLAIDQCTEWPMALARIASDIDGGAFRTARDYDELLSRMDGFVAWSGQVVNNLRAGTAKGVVLPKVVVQRTLPQLQSFASIEDPRQSVFWRPLLNFPAGLSVDDRRRLLAAFDEKLRTKVIPEYRRLHDYLAQEYLPQARDTVAWSELPGGDFWYAWLVRRQTSTRLTPEQVHELGLREVARLHAALAALQPTPGIPGETRHRRCPRRSCARPLQRCTPASTRTWHPRSSGRRRLRSRFASDRRIERRAVRRLTTAKRAAMASVLRCCTSTPRAAPRCRPMRSTPCSCSRRCPGGTCSGRSRAISRTCRAFAAMANGTAHTTTAGHSTRCRWARASACWPMNRLRSARWPWK
jgi:hypothetical protein